MRERTARFLSAIIAVLVAEVGNSREERFSVIDKSKAFLPSGKDGNTLVGMGNSRGRTFEIAEEGEAMRLD